LEWRIAVSLYAVVPICCFIMVVMSPESPYWLICKSRSEDALKSLIILRGKSNIDLVNKDFASISRNYEIQIEQANLSSHNSKVKNYWNILTDRTFLEPFSLLFLILVIGLEWSGFSTISFYMVPFLK
jgi:hypothetical protein